MGKKRGHYLGTEVDGKWWKRYRQDNMFLRGNGEYWYDEGAFYFRRYLIRSVITIPFHEITDIKMGNWHCGRWSWGQPIIKLLWNRQGKPLVSGFVLSRELSESLEIMATLRKLISYYRFGHMTSRRSGLFDYAPRFTWCSAQSRSLFNTFAALGVNVAVLVTQLLLHWPPPAMFGK